MLRSRHPGPKGPAGRAALLEQWSISCLSPTDLPGNVLWLRSSDVVTDGNGRISQANDNSSVGTNDFSQVSEGKRPDLISGTPPVMRFEETDPEANFLLFNNMQVLFGSQHFVVAVVCSLTGSDPDGIFGSQTGTANLLRLNGSTAIYGAASLSWTRTTERAVRLLWHDGTNVEYREDGVVRDSAVASLVTVGTQPAAIGFMAAVPSDRLDGDVTEVVAFSTAEPFSLVQIQALENWLQLEGGC